MFTTVTTNLRTSITAAKPSAILWGVLYYFISAALLFSGVSKVIDPIPTMETQSDIKPKWIATALFRNRYKDEKN